MPTADQLRVRLLLLASGVGAVALWVVIAALVAAASPLPPACDESRSPLTPVRSLIAFTKGADLWTALSDGSQSHQLIDYSAATESPSAPGSAALTPTAAGTPPPGSSPSATTGGGQPTQVLAASISPDGRNVAFIIADAPGFAGRVVLNVINNSTDPGVKPIGLWSDNRYAGPGVAATEISWIPPGYILVIVPNRLSPPTQSMRLVEVINPGQPSNAVVESASEEAYLGSQHDTWAETKSQPLPASVPTLSARIDGPGQLVAGVSSRDVKTPLANRHLTQLLTGTDGKEATHLVCADANNVRPAAFSPTGDLLAVTENSSTLLIDHRHSQTLHAWLDGERLLDWVNVAPAP